MDALIDAAPPFERPPGPAHDGIDAFAHACVTLDVAQPGSREGLGERIQHLGGNPASAHFWPQEYLIKKPVEPAKFD